MKMLRKASVLKVNNADITSTGDLDKARRSRLLNIILLAITGVSALTLFAMLALDLSGADIQNKVSLYIGNTGILVGLVVIFLINRYGHNIFAGSLFILVLLTAISVTDVPEQIVGGRSTFYFTVPILIASVVLRPWASFIVAGIVSVIIGYLDMVLLHNVPGIPTMLGFFAFAFVAWLSANSLENALQELRAINAELDQRVEDRTRELRVANRQLEEANEHLRELDRLKSRFVSMVSHELRTPLTGIQGFAEMIQTGVYGEVNDQQKNALKRILVNTTQLVSIVNDLLDQARIEAGQLSVQNKPFAPRELADDLHATMDLLAQAHSLSLETEVDSDMPDFLLGDRNRLHQILVNLINNAIKFTDEGGITVRFYRPDRAHWAFDVTDTGPGIPEDSVDDIFEPFRQLDSSSTRRHKGVGLGLSIVKQLVELMDGSIIVESALGEGTTFTVILPIVHVRKEAVV
jgi:signal transduction histidine kinase